MQRGVTFWRDAKNVQGCAPDPLDPDMVSGHIYKSTSLRSWRGVLVRFSLFCSYLWRRMAELIQELFSEWENIVPSQRYCILKSQKFTYIIIKLHARTLIVILKNQLQILSSSTFQDKCLKLGRKFLVLQIFDLGLRREDIQYRKLLHDSDQQFIKKA